MDKVTTDPSAAEIQASDPSSSVQVSGVDGGVSTMTIPDAYKVCVNGTCVWVEKSRYCPPSTGCGQKSLASWPGGYCAPSTGCATINGRNYKVLVQPTYTNEESVRIGKCAGSLGFAVADYLTKGFSRLAVAGAGFAAWAC